MKKLLLNPFILMIIIAIGIIYVAIAFDYLGRNKKISAIFEKVAIGVFLISINGVTIFPFAKLNPKQMAGRTLTMPGILFNRGLYGITLFLLFSRLRYNVKDLGYVVSVILTRAPFLGVFCLMIGLSAFWSNDLFHTFKISVSYLETAMIAIYVGKQYSWKELYSLMRWVNLIILLLSIYYANLVPSVGVMVGDWKGVMDHKNTFSFAMALTLVLWLIYGIYNPKQRRISWGISLLALYALNEGGSGASKILFVCMIFLMFYLNVLKNLQPKWAFVSIVIFFIISICLMIVIVDNLEFIVVDTLEKDMTLTGRTLFWPLIIDSIDKKPVLGYGIGGFWQSWRGEDNPARYVVVAKNGWVPPHSHNGFLDMALDLGWLGLSLYILSFLNTLSKAVIYLSQDKMPEAGIPLILLTFTLMTNITETGLLDADGTWFWFVAMTTRLSLDTTGSYNGNK